MEAWLQRIWYGGAPPPGWLRALAATNGWRLARQGSAPLPRTQPPDAPVVVVGNLTVGGTGKTPLVIWLCGQLGALGLKVAVISRGHGGSHSRGPGVLRVDAGMAAALCGDEPLLVHRRTGVPVYVARRRVEAAALARADGAQLLIADDGLQHRALARDCELVVVDGLRGLGNGWLLPAGPLREPAARLARASAVVINGGPQPAGSELVAPGLRRADLPGQPLAMQLSGDQLRNLADPSLTRPLAGLAGQRVHAIAALGNPGRFFAALRVAGLDPVEHPLPDHQPIPASLLAPADGLLVLMTEKDAVKCATLAHAGCWILPVDAGFSAEDARALLRRVIMDARLLELLACPVCKGPLRHVRGAGAEELVCRADRLAFPVREGIPVMLEEEARVLAAGDALLER